MAGKNKIKRTADNGAQLEYSNGRWKRNGKVLMPKRGLRSYIFKQGGKLYTLSEDGKVFPYTPIINALSRKFGDAEQHAWEHTPVIIPDDRQLVYVLSPGSKINGSVFATNILDTLAKHNHRLGNPLSMEELVGLPAHETTFGKYGGYVSDFRDAKQINDAENDYLEEVPLSGFLNTDSWNSGNYSKAASILGQAWRRFNKDSAIDDPVRTMNAEGLLRIAMENYLRSQLTDSEFNSAMNELFPTDFYKWAFDQYRSGKYNPKKKELHKRLVKQKGREFLNSPQGKYWKKTTGDAYNSGIRTDAGEIHNPYLDAEE